MMKVTPVRSLADLIEQYSKISIGRQVFEPIHNILRLIEVANMVDGKPGFCLLPHTYKYVKNNDALMVLPLKAGKKYRQKVLTKGYVVSPTGKYSAYIESVDKAKTMFKVDNGIENCIVSKEHLHLYTTDVIERKGIQDTHLFAIIL